MFIEKTINKQTKLILFYFTPNLGSIHFQNACLYKDLLGGFNKNKITKI